MFFAITWRVHLQESRVYLPLTYSKGTGTIVATYTIPNEAGSNTKQGRNADT
jgi:hypothetical protein